MTVFKLKRKTTLVTMNDEIENTDFYVIVPSEKKKNKENKNLDSKIVLFSIGLSSRETSLFETLNCETYPTSSLNDQFQKNPRSGSQTINDFAKNFMTMKSFLKSYVMGGPEIDLFSIAHVKV